MPSIKNMLAQATMASAAAASSLGKVNVYYGQAGSHQLQDVCATGVEYVTLAFVDVTPENGGLSGYAGDNFANHCWAGYYSDSTLLNTCPTLTNGLAYCHSVGTKVLLSIGGVYSAGSNYTLSSDANAHHFADFLWGSFGPYDAAYAGPRPFDVNGEHFSVDGFDFDIEEKFEDQGPWNTLVSDLRGKFDDAAGEYLITAAPQCPFSFSGFQMADILATSHFDLLWVQFYNNIACDALSGGFNLEAWISHLAGGPNADTPLFIGLPGSPEAASSGYVAPELLAPLLATYSALPNFGGVMIWDEYYAQENSLASGGNYLELVQALLGDSKPTQSASSVVPTSILPTSAASSSVVSSTTCSTTSSTVVSSALSSATPSAASSSVVSSVASSTAVPSTAISSVVSRSSASCATSSVASSTAVSSSAISSPIASSVASSSVLSSIASSSSAVSSAASTASSSAASSTVSSSAVSSVVSGSAVFSATSRVASSSAISSAVSSSASSTAATTSAVSSSAASSSASSTAVSSIVTPSAVSSSIVSSGFPTSSSYINSTYALSSILSTSVPVSRTLVSSPASTGTASGSSYTTSTVQTTLTSTIYSCAPTVINCPYGKVTTVVVDLYTTVCPVTAAEGTATGTATGTAAAPTAPAATASATLSVSTIYSTLYKTITSCAATVTNCPARVSSTVVAVGTTVVPVPVVSGSWPAAVSSAVSSAAVSSVPTVIVGNAAAASSSVVVTVVPAPKPYGNWSTAAASGVAKPSTGLTTIIGSAGTGAGPVPTTTATSSPIAAGAASLSGSMSLVALLAAGVMLLM